MSAFTDRTLGRLVGVLFIVASVAAIIGGSLLLPLQSDDYLAEVAAAEGQVVTGALIELVLVLSVLGIAALLLPVLRRHNEGLAVGYLATRTLEAVLLAAAAVSALVVLSLGRGHGTGEAGVSALGDALLATRDWTYLLGSLVALGISTLILNALLRGARLVPGWLTVWGLVGGALVLLRGVIEAYGVDLSGAVQAVLAAPIGVQEMVLAGWLIIRGFDTSHLPDGPAAPSVHDRAMAGSSG